METFASRRVVRGYTAELEAAPDTVFPLLCPTREYEWVNGWACDIVYSESGLAEQDCVFKTDLPHRGESTWYVSRHDPGNFIVEFVIFHGVGAVEKSSVSLDSAGNGKAVCRWTRTYTGLTESGNAFIETFTGPMLDSMMEKLFRSLNHFCWTGSMLAE